MSGFYLLTSDRAENYHLFEHNCNTFSSEVAMFLTGNKIPQHIQDLPSEVLNTYVVVVFNSLGPDIYENAYSPHCSPNISFESSKENCVFLMSRPYPHCSLYILVWY